MTEPNTRDNITVGQRKLLRALLREAEFDLRTVTFMFRRLSVPERWIGRPTDDWIDSLTKPGASSVIERLQAIVS